MHNLNRGIPSVFPSQHFFNQRQVQARVAWEIPVVIQQVLERPLSWFKEDASRQAPAGEPLLTQVAFALDKSKSMDEGKSVTIEGFNTQLGNVQDGAKEVGETRMTLTQFSHEVSLSYVGVPVSQIQPLTNESYRPDGYTALYDAIGDTLEALLALPRTDSAACATLVTIFTDGDDNASHRYSPGMLHDLIEKLEATGRWTFALVGPARGVQSLADILAVSRSNITGFEPSSVASRSQVMGAMAMASSSYMTSRANGATQVLGLYQADKGL